MENFARGLQPWRSECRDVALQAASLLAVKLSSYYDCEAAPAVLEALVKVVARNNAALVVLQPWRLTRPPPEASASFASPDQAAGEALTSSVRISGPCKRGGLRAAFFVCSL
jgi:hypothetical protein